MKRFAALLTAASLFTGFSAFAADKIFDYTDDGVITAYYGESDAVIPSSIDGTPIKEIGEKAFFDIEISTVNMYDGVQKIGTSAFEGSNISYANLAPTVREIGDRAFANCDSLECIELHSDDVQFGKDALSGTHLIQITIPCMSDYDKIAESALAAKGDDNFIVMDKHTALSITPQPGGGLLFSCADCDYTENADAQTIGLPFNDVKAEDWYYPYIATVYSGIGILKGKSETEFDPEAGLTCAEAAKIAACIHALQTNPMEEFTPTGDNWYDVYVDYCRTNGIIEDYIDFEWDKNATRAQMSYLFSRCDAIPHYVNDIPLTDIPDVHDTTPFAYEILDLYNKGIAVGSDEKYTFHPDSKITRGEAAALIARIAFTEMRKELPKG